MVTNNIGHIINVYDGWGGEMYAQKADSALVRVIARIEETVTPTFTASPFSMSAQNGDLSIMAVLHPLVTTPLAQRFSPPPQKEIMLALFLRESAPPRLMTKEDIMGG